MRDVLVLDETFAVGDASFRERCEERYRELRAAGQTVPMMGHDPNVIARFCNRALLLDEGRIVMSGPADEVADRSLSLLMHNPPQTYPFGAVDRETVRQTEQVGFGYAVTCESRRVQPGDAPWRLPRVEIRLSAGSRPGHRPDGQPA